MISFTVLADRNVNMSRKTHKASFEQAMEALRAHSFDVSPHPGAAGTMLVSKQGAAALLAPGKDAPAAYAEGPGLLVQGELARLLDRGYQKFLKTSHFEVPATAAQLHAIHAFSEELNQIVGAINFYNESLGTTSDLYQYDRLKGRQAAGPVSAAPWESREPGH
jgi:hypothetical protein